MRTRPPFSPSPPFVHSSVKREGGREVGKGGREGERGRARSNSSTNQFASKGGFARSLGPFYHPFSSSSAAPLPTSSSSSFYSAFPSTLPFRERIQSASKTPYNHPPSGIRRSTSRFSTLSLLTPVRDAVKEPAIVAATFPTRSSSVFNYMRMILHMYALTRICTRICNIIVSRDMIR